VANINLCHALDCPTVECGDGIVTAEGPDGRATTYADNEECDAGEDNGVACELGFGDDSCTYCNTSCKVVTVTPDVCEDEVANNTGDEGECRYTGCVEEACSTDLDASNGTTCSTDADCLADVP
jgi:hypothetical protein